MKNLSLFLKEHSKKNTVAIVGPLFNSSIKILKEPIIFVDGGSKYQINNEGICIGDGDSSQKTMDVKLNTEKNFSDLEYTLNKITNSFKYIYLFGFLGGRKDHELINFGVVYTFLKNRMIETKVLLDDSILAFSKGSWEIELKGTFSIFLFEDTKLKITGNLKYSIENEEIIKGLTSKCLSNEAYGSIQIKTSKPLFIFNSSCQQN